jgi:thiamine pyrophosphokinase
MPAKEVDQPATARLTRSKPIGGRRAARRSRGTNMEDPMRIVVVASGALLPGDVAWLEGADAVIAADGGGAALDRLGRRPDRLVGDLDSADAALVERLDAAGVRIERHPTDKEASDTELAVRAAVADGADRIDLLGVTGGDRLDHELANLLLLADPQLDAVELRAVAGRTTIRALRSGRSLALTGLVGDLVTLLPLGGAARGLTTTGLRWPLDGATLRMGGSRGLSNVIVEAGSASVRLADGLLLVVETTSSGDLR